METAIWQAYQDEGVIMLGIINTSNQNQINNFVIENSLTFPILFDPGSSGGVQGGNTYDDFYMPNDAFRNNKIISWFNRYITKI